MKVTHILLVNELAWGSKAGHKKTLREIQSEEASHSRKVI